MSLCEPCQELHDGWVTYQVPYTKWIQYERGSTRSVESYHAKAEERRELVRRQLAMIDESCKNKHQAKELKDAA